MTAALALAFGPVHVAALHAAKIDRKQLSVLKIVVEELEDVGVAVLVVV